MYGCYCTAGRLTAETPGARITPGVAGYNAKKPISSLSGGAVAAVMAAEECLSCLGCVFDGREGTIVVISDISAFSVTDNPSSYIE